MIQLIRGFKDILPGEVELWQKIEKTARSLLEDFGFKEIRIPIMERTELFARSIGEDTDIVERETLSPFGPKPPHRSVAPISSTNCMQQIRSGNFIPSVPCFVESGPKKGDTGSSIRSMLKFLVWIHPWLMLS
jgi:hypothetical protein